MIERNLDIPTPDGAMNTFVVHPEEDGPFPVVLFYMDAFGKREELHDMARRIACVGYYVMLPNLYYRAAREVSPPTDEASTRRLAEVKAHMTTELVMRDTRAMLDFIGTDPQARRSSVGALGYCMSGPLVFAAAGRYPDDIRCAASIYGVRLATDQADSPHLLAHCVKGELYFACAERDSYAPREMIERLEAHLRTLPDLRYRLEWYPGVEHGFAFPERRNVYDKASAERHWERLFSLFRRALG